MSNQDNRHYNLAIDKFMEECCSRLRKLANIEDWSLFYNIKDKDFILYELSHVKARNVWEKMMSVGGQKFEQSELSKINRHNPFYILAREYGEYVYYDNHNENTDILQLRDMLEEAGVSLEEIFSDEWYNKTIHKIRNEIIELINNNRG